MKPEVIQKVRQAGLEFLGCYRAANGTCYFLACRAENKDYGDKEGYRFDAWEEAAGGLLDHSATLMFFASRSALSTAKVQRLIETQPDLLKRLGLARLKRMLDAGTEHLEITLSTYSTESEFEVNDPSGDPLIAQRRLRDEIIRDLAVRHANGEKTIRYEVIRDRLCFDEDWIQRAFRLLGKQNLVEGLSNGNLRLTDDGHLAAENVVSVSPVSIGIETFPIALTEKPMDCFVSYAGEDREIVKRLVNALTERSVQVWWDKGQITLGDRLSQKIEEGLRLSRYGLVMISHHFLEKNWPQTELRALHARAVRSGQKVILPVLIGLDHVKFGNIYPLLDDLVTTEFSGDIEALADEIVRAVK